jgi:hypothetical protein
MGHFVFRDSRRFYLQACHSVNKGALDVWKAGMLGDGALDSAIGHEFGPPILELCEKTLAGRLLRQLLNKQMPFKVQT